MGDLQFQLLGGPADVDVPTVTLQAIDPVTSVPLGAAVGAPTAVGDGNGNGVEDVMVKFDRSSLQGWFPGATMAVFRVEGLFTDGTHFEGTDAAVRIIDNGSEHTDEDDHGSVSG